MTFNNWKECIKFLFLKKAFLLNSGVLVKLHENYSVFIYSFKGKTPIGQKLKRLNDVPGTNGILVLVGIKMQWQVSCKSRYNLLSGKFSLFNQTVFKLILTLTFYAKNYS